MDAIATSASSVEGTTKAPSTAPSLGGLLKALRRRWLMASFLSLTAAAAVVAAVWFFLPPPPHEASVVFHVSAIPPAVPFIGSGSSGGGEFAIYQQGQKALLTSRLVINAALRDPKISELRMVKEWGDPIAELQKELKVDFKAGPEYMRLALRGDRPDEVLAIITAISEAYLKEFSNREHHKMLEHLEKLKDILAKYEDGLRRKRESVRKLTLAVGSGDPQVLTIKQRYFVEALGQVEKELLHVKSELRKAELKFAAAKGRQAGTVEWVLPDNLVDQEILKDHGVLQLQAEWDIMERKLAPLVLRAKNGEKEESLQPLIRERDTAVAAIAARKAAIRPQVIARLREQGTNGVKVSAEQAREEESFLKQLEAQLTAEAETLRKQTTSLNVGQVDVENFKEEIAQSEKVAGLVAARAETLKVELEAPARVNRVEEPYVTQEDPFRRQVKAAAIAGAVVFLLALGLIGWREHSLRRVDGVKDLPGALGLPVIGAVPALPDSRAYGRAKAYRELRGASLECIDGARARLVHATSTDGVRVVLVTSAVPREGKTALASQLAASLARAGHRTVLVDGDLRLPTLHRVFENDAEIGIAEVLRVEAHPSAAIHDTSVERLSLMPAGSPDLRAVHALSHVRLPGLIDWLRREYDYVVIDSAPLLPVVDSLLLSKHVDGVIVSVLREVSQVHVVRSACDRLEQLNVPILGVVLNGADVRNLYGNWYGRAYEERYQRVASRSDEEATTDVA